MEVWKNLLEVRFIISFTLKFYINVVHFEDLSRRNSIELGETSRESEFVVLKERKLVATLPVLNGMLRFSFLLEICPPGSVPDPHLLAAVLDLVRCFYILLMLCVFNNCFFSHTLPL